MTRGRGSARGRGRGQGPSRGPPATFPNSVPNKQGCWTCGKDHLQRDCPTPRPPRSRNMRSAPLSAACVVRNSHKNMILTSALFPAQAFNDILTDTGAQFSSINKCIADKWKLKVYPPQPGAPQVINGATSSMRTPRIGHVDIPICVHLPLNPRQEVTFARKRFEVVETDSEFIFGVELLRELFPGDALLQFAGPHSCITDAPRPTSVVAARMNTVEASPYVVDEDVDESSDPPHSLSTNSYPRFPVQPDLLYGDPLLAPTSAAPDMQ